LQKVALVFGAVLATTLVVACSSPVTSSSNSPVIVKSVSAGEIPSLGAAASFAVFGGGAGITNQGTQTTIQGDIGTTGASTMLSGFHSASFVYIETPLNVGAVNGLVYTAAPQGSPADLAVAQACAADALTAFNNLAGLAGGIDPGAGQLGGLTLYSGVYKSAAGPFSITGSDLTLDAQGNSDAAWVFQMASALTVGGPAAPRNIILAGGAQAKNVFWQVGSAATINGAGGGSMVGTIIASSGITFSTPGNATATSLNGRALALFASVTMVNTIINAPSVAVATSGVSRSLAAAANQVTVSGSTAADVAAVVSGGGSITVVNNGAHVAATQTGTGAINATNNGGVLTATNSGTGIMTITSNATGAVTVTNTGNGRVTVNATGAAAIAIVHTGNADFVYP
jgi:hypothetical protein